MSMWNTRCETATAIAPAHWSAAGKKEWVGAVVTGEHSQTGTKDGKDMRASGIYADTWLKRNGRWLVIDSVFP